jgi:hypothetical protein
MNNPSVDPTTLSLADLRELRSQQQAAEDAISYVRRLVQARLDLVSAEQKRRNNGEDRTVSDDLPAILGRHLNSGPARPPRPTVDLSDHPIAVELDELCSGLGAHHITELNDTELTALSDALQAFEQARSSERRELFGTIDALSAELVRRYRDGEAKVDDLLADE